MKILLAVDGSKSSTQTASWIAKHSALFAAPVEIVLFHAGQRLMRTVEIRLGRSETASYYASMSKYAFAAARRVLKRAGIAFDESFEVGSDAAELIARAAVRKRCDLVLMGSRGHGPIRQALLGSIAAKVIARSTVPVLVAR
mgnify:CR=1 FL=1